MISSSFTSCHDGRVGRLQAAAQSISFLFMDTTRQSLIFRLGNLSDNRSWGEFVALYRPLLTSYVRKMGLREQETDELVQDLLVHLLTAVKKYDPLKGRFRTWLYRVVKNYVIARIRDGAQEERKFQDSVKELGLKGESEDPEPDAEWERAYQQRVFEFACEQIRNELEKTETGKRQWKCFQEYTLGERKAEDVARALGIDAVNNVRVYSHRVFQRLRDKCLEYDAELSESGNEVDAT